MGRTRHRALVKPNVTPKSAPGDSSCNRRFPVPVDREPGILKAVAGPLTREFLRLPAQKSANPLASPGGSLDPGEEPLDAARRELKEEAGITAANWSKLGEIALMTKCTARLHMFIARNLTVGEQELTSTETGMTVEWWPLQEAVAAAMDGKLLLSGAAVSVLMAANTLHTPGRA
ncbi:ADP-ribose pyrophosphatase YjhB (NUDIX family) [Kitasatospora sp. GP30]|nr:ADP-ribose pyrophosphatase YjhB (NUDIX family) [Kitasatospora sp. GP30]